MLVPAHLAFTLYHADQMPLMRMGETSVERVGDNLFKVRVDIRNDRLIPSITEKGQQNHVVRPDLLTVDGNVEVVAVGWVPNKHQPGPTDIIDQEELDRIMVRSGHPGRTTRTVEYLVRGSGSMTVEYASVKGGTVRTTVQLR